MATVTVTDEQAWALLRIAENAWRVRDVQSLGVGIELLTVNDEGLITNWEAVLHKEVV